MSDLVEREAAGYQYLNEKFEAIHITSVPMTDQEALEYFPIVAVWFNDTAPKYVMKRGFDEHDYKLIPYQYDAESKEVSRIEGT